MSDPKPPEDQELKNIIDKLANFVARNGPEFENMTKQKQQGNPKFSFLFSGEYYPYYRHKVAFEHAALQNAGRSEAHSDKQHSHQAPFSKQPLLQSPSGDQTIPSSQSEKLQALIGSLQEQISQSENNLSAQFQAIMQLQQKNVEERLISLKMKGIEKEAQGLGLSLKELGTVLEPVINTCTKDAIAAGKTWVLEHFTDNKHAEVMMQYILERLLAKENSFDDRLHLIYLLNDIVHHSSRKGLAGLIEVVERLVLVPAFAFTHISATEEEKKKMMKLLTLWENHKYFRQDTINHLKDPAAGLASYQAQLISMHPCVVADVSMETNKQLQLLRQQHHDFVQHINSQIAVLQQQLVLSSSSTHNSNNSNNNSNSSSSNSSTSNENTWSKSSQASENLHPSSWLPSMKQPPPFDNSVQGSGSKGALGEEVWKEKAQEVSPAAINLPDLTKPPPGFPPITQQPPPPMPELDLVPNIPYHDLPAGLIVPLVKLEDCDYVSLDPSSLRLPPPMPPTERLLAAVEAFYAPPSHDRPRDGDGWEKLGLFEFFKAKNKAVTMKTTTKTTTTSHPNDVGNKHNSNNNNNNASDANATSKKRTFVEHKKSSHKRNRSRSSSPRDRSFSRSRSATPDHDDDGVDAFIQSVDKNSRLLDDNRGHQLMKKMGWGGGGLGSSGAGIVDPIDGGEVRDKVDQFKGLGMNLNDPFEKYRKSMSSGFNSRLKDRTDFRPRNH